MKKINNPNRECIECGSTASNDKVKVFNDEKKMYIYYAKCKNCIAEAKKRKLVSICSRCKGPKVENYQSYCRSCAAEYQRNRKKHQVNKIHAGILIEVKAFIEKMIENNFIADLIDLNNLITYFNIISNGCIDLDHKSGGEQLQVMWDELYSFYGDILKDFNTELLAIAVLVRTSRCGRPKLNLQKSSSFAHLKRICNECKIEKSGSHYYTSGYNNIRSVCKACMIQRSRKNKNKKKLISNN
jgi:hypothetical protein